MTLLSATDISYTYLSGPQALCKVSVELYAGKVMGILGPNGSGKSTLLKLLAGQVPLQSGHVTLKGKAMESMRPKERGRIAAYLPQFVHPAFNLNVYETVALGRYPHMNYWGQTSSTHDDWAIHRCLEMTGCAEIKDRDFQTLSGGERQRALLASILAQEPELLLLDEPTAALDLHHQEETFAMLRKLAKDANYGVMVVTHDLNLAGRYCDQLLLLDQKHHRLAFGSVESVLRAELLSKAYGAAIQVAVNPFTGTPLVHPAPQGDL